MEISAEKTKLMANTNGINADIKVSGEKLETVNSFKIPQTVSQTKDQDQKISPELRKQQLQ